MKSYQMKPQPSKASLSLAGLSPSSTLPTSTFNSAWHSQTFAPRVSPLVQFRSPAPIKAKEGYGTGSSTNV